MGKGLWLLWLSGLSPGLEPNRSLDGKVNQTDHHYAKWNKPVLIARALVVVLVPSGEWEATDGCFSSSLSPSLPLSLRNKWKSFLKMGQVLKYTLIQRGHTSGPLTYEKKKCSISLVIREMQKKTMMIYHLTLVRITIIDKSTNNKC